jgi:hypothetical protein
VSLFTLRGDAFISRWGSDMRYYKLIRGMPGARFNEVRGVIRIDRWHYELFDRHLSAWVDHPELLGMVSGLGGDGYDFKPITPAKADAIIKKLSDNF